ncbi:MAG: energy transducer TonB [Bacteroidota bacterium]
MSNRTLFITLISLGILSGLYYMQSGSTYPSKSHEETVREEIEKREMNESGLETSENYQSATPTNLPEIKQKIGYPNQAREKGIEGTVLIRILVDENGQYKFHKITADPNPLLTKAVEMYIDELNFTPEKRNGVNVQTWTTIPFIFSLQVQE